MLFKNISIVLLAVVLGVAMAWIRPAQPKQVEQAAVPNFAKKTTQHLLDNEDIPLENSIHNSRKCKSILLYTIKACSTPSLLTLTLVFCFGWTIQYRWFLHWSKLTRSDNSL